RESPSMTPCQPLRKPTMEQPCSAVPRLTTARMAALSPGQSPPPVRIPMRIWLLVSGRAPVSAGSNIDVERYRQSSGSTHLSSENCLDRVSLANRDLHDEFIVNLQKLPR